MNVTVFSIALLLAGSLLVQRLPAAQQKTSILEGKESFALRSKHLAVELSTTRPQLLRLSVDSLGFGQFRPSALRSPAPAPRHTVSERSGTSLEYRRQGLPRSAPARWTFQLGDQGLTLVSRWTEDDPPEPVVLEFDPHLCHATLLGRINPDGSVRLPTLLHLPDQGTFRIGTTDSSARRWATMPAGSASATSGSRFPRRRAGGGRSRIAGKSPRSIRALRQSPATPASTVSAATGSISCN